MHFQMPHMFEGLTKAGHLEVVSRQNVAQHFNPLFLQLQYDLKSRQNKCDAAHLHTHIWEDSTERVDWGNFVLQTVLIGRRTDMFCK